MKNKSPPLGDYPSIVFKYKTDTKTKAYYLKSKN